MAADIKGSIFYSTILTGIYGSRYKRLGILDLFHGILDFTSCSLLCFAKWLDNSSDGMADSVKTEINLNKNKSRKDLNYC